jgi:hypothetical protein
MIYIDELQLNNALVATRQTLQLQVFTTLQLQLNKHSSCDMTNTSIAIPQALQLQLWTCTPSVHELMQL